jgi:hypothetical protein
MKSAVLAAALFACAAPGVLAQEDDLGARKAEKLKSEFLKKADWILDYDKAREEAKKTGKPMFTLFSRSYAPCPACHALESGPLLTDDFVKFSKDYVLFCHITSMIPGEKYGDLLEEKGGNAFPWIVFMDAAGEIIMVHGGPRSAEAFAKTGAKAKEYMALQAKAEKGDAAAKVDFAILQVTYYKITVADAEKVIKESGPLTKEQQAAWDSAQVDGRVREDMRSVKSDEDEAVLGRKYYARFKEGKAVFPTSDLPLQYFAVRLLEASEEAKDADAFEAALKVLKDRYGKIEDFAPFFAARDKDLEALRAKDKK